MKSTSPIRATVLYTGRVQGVGFRMTTVSIARRYDVTGYVANLPDGRVELVAEGTPPEVDAFLRDVQDQCLTYIRDHHRDSSPATSEFTGFDIRY